MKLTLFRPHVALACVALLAAAVTPAKAQLPPSGWSSAAWTSDATSGVDGTKRYTHAYNFGSSVGTTINGIPFTGRAGGAPSVAGSFSTANYGNLFTGDGNNINAGGSSQLARDFVYGDGVNNQSITLLGLTPGVEYVFTLYTVGWEGAGARKAKFFFGTEDSQIIDQDAFGDNNGQRISYRYTPTASSITLAWTPQQVASIHAYGFANYEATTPVPVSISGQPASQCVQLGGTAVFTVTAVGSAPITYQWKKDGIDIDGELSSTLTLPNVDTSKAGVYTVVVHNNLNTVTSSGAKLEIGINTLLNPSFEADNFTVFPGYVSGNGPITSWNALGGHGINPGGGSPFADNGTIPSGTHVAFMQQDGAMSQLVSGFTPGSDYYVVYYENARNGGTPALSLQIADTTIVQAHRISPVGGNNPYVRVDSDVFTASTDTLQLTFTKSNPAGGDTTALIDNVCIIEVPPSTAPTITKQPLPLIVQVGESASFTVTAFGSQPFSYQWKSNGVDIAGATDRTYTIASALKTSEAVYSVQVDNPGGTAVSSGAQLTVWEPISGLYGTGLDAAGLPLADGSIDAHYKITLNPDVAGSTDAFVEDSGAFPIVAGPWLPNNAKTK
ncbi:MAG TPA: immunoglobulin domain-containing protein, partial [Candidatus Saccharimonadales bacterium]|nr:immunoglobulin domain-containing protein [Candidatus Saccharimonadales bacterium]